MHARLQVRVERDAFLREALVGGSERRRRRRPRCARLSTRLSTRLPARLSARLSARLPTRLSARLSARLPARLSAGRLRSRRHRLVWQAARLVGRLVGRHPLRRRRGVRPARLRRRLVARHEAVGGVRQRGRRLAAPLLGRGAWPVGRRGRGLVLQVVDHVLAQDLVLPLPRRRALQPVVVRRRGRELQAAQLVTLLQHRATLSLQPHSPPTGSQAQLLSSSTHTHTHTHLLSNTQKPITTKVII